jgi:hypothetical protein
MSHGKCAYCEKCGEPLEVEHYLCRHEHKCKVVEWTNLLPVCHQCNNNKSDHDCKAEPIIDPSTDNPKDHLIYKNLRFYERTQKGKCTIEYLKMYNSDMCLKKWKDISDRVDLLIDDCRYRVNNISNAQTVDKKILQRLVCELFGLTRPEHEYSALYASEIFQNPYYNDLKKQLKHNNLWNAELQQKEKYALSISLYN